MDFIMCPHYRFDKLVACNGSCDELVLCNAFRDELFACNGSIDEQVDVFWWTSESYPVAIGDAFQLSKNILVISEHISQHMNFNCPIAF